MFHTNLTIYFITHIFIDWFIILKNHNETLCNHNILSVWSMALRNKPHVSGITGACWWIQIIKMANICGSDNRYCSKKLTTFPESIDNFCILSFQTCRSSHWCLVRVWVCQSLCWETPFEFTSYLTTETYQEQKSNKEALERSGGVVPFCSASSSITLTYRQFLWKKKSLPSLGNPYRQGAYQTNLLMLQVTQ